jgi:hypothetical protein
VFIDQLPPGGLQRFRQVVDKVNSACELDGRRELGAELSVDVADLATVVEGSPPKKLPTMERDRTVMPRTTPRLLTTLYPGSVGAVVTIESCMGLPLDWVDRATGMSSP